MFGLVCTLLSLQECREKVNPFELGRFGECKEAVGLFSEVISATWMCAGCALECFGID